jgi:aryl-alcohol dehydrogenase-like predicted oxidoreductase
MGEEFMYRQVPAFQKRVFRLGLAGNYGIETKGVEAALDRGVNYLFCTYRSGKLLKAAKPYLARDREKYVVAAGPTVGFFSGSIRRAWERTVKTLGLEYIDLFQLFWLGTTSAWTPANVAELVKLKEEGKVRALGISIHDRPRAGRLAEESPLDALMIRYNAAHPGAEKDIFPHLAKRKPAVVAYTATSWRKLLKRPRGWKGEVPTAGHCYRFCLSSPHVDLVLSGPASVAQLDENLAALQQGPLSEQEMGWMREFGQAVHG